MGKIEFFGAKNKDGDTILGKVSDFETVYNTEDSLVYETKKDREEGNEVLISDAENSGEKYFFDENEYQMTFEEYVGDFDNSDIWLGDDENGYSQYAPDVVGSMDEAGIYYEYVCELGCNSKVYGVCVLSSDLYVDEDGKFFIMEIQNDNMQTSKDWYERKNDITFDENGELEYSIVFDDNEKDDEIQETILKNIEDKLSRKIKVNFEIDIS